MISKLVRTSFLALCAFALTVVSGCTVAGEMRVDDSTSGSPAPDLQPDPAHASAVEDPDACAAYAWVNLDGASARIQGDLVDTGVREFAEGTVAFDEEGNIVSYTVASGDGLEAIGERLCIQNGMTLRELNHVRTIYPDQVLRLTADPNLLFVPYFNPRDAPEGFPQVPYQEAIEAMGRAADDGDVDAMREIWAEGLSGMFTDPVVINGIQDALDAGDLEVLDQMFS